MSNAQIPKQKVSYKEKKADDFAWAKNTIKAWIDRADFNSARKQEIYKLYDVYNGRHDLKDYSYVTDPYKTEKSRGQIRKYPARIRTYNIIKPVVDLLVGERGDRPFNYQVVVRNSDIKSRYEEYRTQQYLSYMEQLFVNKLNESGIETGVPSKEVPPEEEFAKQVETSYRDKRAIIGQQAMDYIVDRVELQDKLQTAFFDWVVTGEVYSYKGTLFNEVDYECVSPTDILYEKPKNVRFLEDGDMAGQRKMMSVNQVVDMFYDVLTADEIDQLEAPSQNGSAGFSIPFLNQVQGKGRDDNFNDERLVEVYHINWKSFTEVGFLEVPDGLGGVEVLEVDRSYKPLPGDVIEWHWVGEAWEGYQIDKNIYKHMRPVTPQRNELTNKSTCKLSYNGTAYSDRNSKNVSIVEMGIPYQILYNVFHYRMELSIAKNKDKIMLMEMNTIPKKHGWDEEKFMYTADALGYAFIDSTAVGQNKERVNFNQFQVLDMSLGQYISAQFELLQAIKGEWEEFLGISRQRKGQIMASDGARNSQAAIGQSNIMTAELFRKFAKFEEREMQGLLDVSKVAWKEGKHSTYMNDEGREAILSIGPDDIQDADLGLFLKNSSKEDEKLQAIKQFSLEFAQNGSAPSTIAEILDGNNFAKLKEKVKEVEAAERKHQAEQEQVAGQQQQQMEQLRQQALKEEREFKAAETDKKIASDQKIADDKIDLEYVKLGQSEPPEDKSIEYDKLAIQREGIASKERIENKKIAASKNKPKN